MSIEDFSFNNLYYTMSNRQLYFDPTKTSFFNYNSRNFIFEPEYKSLNNNFFFEPDYKSLNNNFIFPERKYSLFNINFPRINFDSFNFKFRQPVYNFHTYNENKISSVSKPNTETNSINTNSINTASINTSSLNSLVNTAQGFVGKSATQMQALMQKSQVLFHRNAWCADSVYYVAKQTFGNNISSWYKKCWYPHCTTTYNAAKQNSAIVAEKKNGKIDIQHVVPGHIIFYDWQKGQNIDPQKIDHVGIVKSVNYNTGEIITLEGNTGRKFKECKRNINNGNIVAFADITKSVC